MDVELEAGKQYNFRGLPNPSGPLEVDSGRFRDPLTGLTFTKYGFNHPFAADDSRHNPITLCDLVSLYNPRTPTKTSYVHKKPPKPKPDLTLQKLDAQEPEKPRVSERIANKLAFQKREFGGIGEAIPGSSLVRDYCTCCFQPIRVVDHSKPNVCLDCQPTGVPGRIDLRGPSSEINYHGSRFHEGEW